MTIREWLNYAHSELGNSTTPRLDAEILLCDSFNKDKAWLIAHDDIEIPVEMAEDLRAKLNIRTLGTPLGYMRGKAPFYGREFFVTPDVLIPRPETETMIELALVEIRKQYRDKVCKIADVGTGSGAIGITLASELENADVYCLDISQEALGVASRNASSIGVSVHCVYSDLLSGIDQDFDVLCANLPYVPQGFSINIDATHEPSLALFGGIDGLDLYRTMFTQITASDKKPRYIFTESLPESHESLCEIASHAGYILNSSSDLIQVFEYKV